MKNTWFLQPLQLLLYNILNIKVYIYVSTKRVTIYFFCVFHNIKHDLVFYLCLYFLFLFNFCNHFFYSSNTVQLLIILAKTRHKWEDGSPSNKDKYVGYARSGSFTPIKLRPVGWTKERKKDRRTDKFRSIQKLILNQSV